ncbi:MAG: transposase [Bryobacterales bacterium]|nr:transposase [Bryobacterales bacterium]
MTTPNPILVAGIDVGKAKLDVHIAEGSLERQFHNDKCGRRALRNWLLKRAVTRAVLEPTGRYHRNLHQCLCDAGIETVVVNPLRSRRFAEALGLFAKNDRVDAAMLARFGQLGGLEAPLPPPRNLTLLSDLLAVRRKLGALRKLVAQLAREAAGCPAASLAALQADIASCEHRMLACIAADPALSRRTAIIQSVPGCGPVTAACLCAEMPELGTLDRRQVASLLGLAPFDRDSGQLRGGRSIRGGRAKPRHLLYMTALAAIRWNPGSKACYERLTARGKPPKVALVAVMRKLASLLNTLLREDRMWQAEPPNRQLEAAA